MSNQIRISAKNLGEVALPHFCPRCFWVRLRVGNRLPFQIFPGIFSSIDSYSKRVVHGCFDKNGSPPAWLGDLGPLVDYVDPPHHSKFRIRDQVNDILLTGSPDGVFRRPDGSHVIVDYKTSRYTAHQDRLYPMYKVQLNAYARIAAECGLDPVTGLALIYTEPVTDATTAFQDGNHAGGGFAMSFQAYIRDVPLESSILEPLLATTREIYDLDTSPPGRAGCKDCRGLDGLLELVSGR